MRTTIEIKDKLRVELLRRATQEGTKGFSHIIEKALVNYFDQEDKTMDLRKKALGLKGCLNRSEAEKLYAETNKIRASW
jgi:metal-responsive CopG/Arc/MetJ family transcriptional regulator